MQLALLNENDEEQPGQNLERGQKQNTVTADSQARSVSNRQRVLNGLTSFSYILALIQIGIEILNAGIAIVIWLPEKMEKYVYISSASLVFVSTSAGYIRSLVILTVLERLERLTHEIAPRLLVFNAFFGIANNVISLKSYCPMSLPVVISGFCCPIDPFKDCASVRNATLQLTKEPLQIFWFNNDTFSKEIYDELLDRVPDTVRDKLIATLPHLLQILTVVTMVSASVRQWPSNNYFKALTLALCLWGLYFSITEFLEGFNIIQSDSQREWIALLLGLINVIEIYFCMKGLQIDIYNSCISFHTAIAATFYGIQAVYMLFDIILGTPDLEMPTWQFALITTVALLVSSPPLFQEVIKLVQAQRNKSEVNDNARQELIQCGEESGAGSLTPGLSDQSISMKPTVNLALKVIKGHVQCSLCIEGYSRGKPQDGQLASSVPTPGP